MAESLTQRVQRLEAQQSWTVRALQLILQGRWNGEMPHAEAIVKAINLDDTDWSAVPFPKP